MLKTCSPSPMLKKISICPVCVLGGTFFFFLFFFLVKKNAQSTYFASYSMLYILILLCFQKQTKQTHKHFHFEDSKDFCLCYKIY